MYKLYVRPHLDYGDLLYHNQVKDSMSLLESVQYSAGLIVAGCWKGTNILKLYNELGWESLSDRRHFRRLSLFYHIKNGLSPTYLVDGINYVPLNVTKRYSNSFSPYYQKHWTTLDESIKNSSSLSKFKSSFLKTIIPPQKPYFHIADKYGLSLLTKLRVNFSDLREHRFRHNFNCQSPVCSCQSGNECIRHCF